LIFKEFSGMLRRMKVESSTVRAQGPGHSSYQRFLFPGMVACLVALILVLLWYNHRLRQEILSLKRQIVALELRERELESQIGQLQGKINQLQKEKEELLQNAVGLLRQRSTLMRKLISELGLSRYVRKTVTAPPSGQGGPYLPPTEEYRLLLERMDKYLKVMKHVPLGKPCQGYISSYYGFRRDPFTGKRAFHAGIDIVGRYGAPVRATADGVVYRVGYQKGLGRYVKIRHHHGYITVYGHLCKYVVRRGEKVKKGDIIGYLGNTGRSTGPHVHYEIRYWGRPINPLKFIRAERKLAKLAR